MRRTWIIALLLCTAGFLSAQERDAAYSLSIEQVEIAAERPLSATGVQRTIIDSVVLRDNIASSLADALTNGSPIFIKSYGRATLATASFRGTAPSHTQVTWNGMRLNSPMLGQVDFSLIPSYFVDRAELYHGASSVGVTGGGLGGAVTLNTRMPEEPGITLNYIQGIGSFKTFDEYLRFAYRGRKWSTSTRFLCSASENDFKFRNYDTKEFQTDDNGQIIGSYYPLQRNRNGDFRDLHLMQEVFYNSDHAGRFSLAAWYLDSHRGLAMLSTDRNESNRKKNTQDERTLRTVAGWERLNKGLKLAASAGYTYTELTYQMLVDPAGEGNFRPTIDARSYVHSFFVKAEAEYSLGQKWLFTFDVTPTQHRVTSGDRAIVDNLTGEYADTLYRQQRFELSAFAAVKWRPVPRLGLAVNLREELYGNKVSSPIPAGFIDYLLSKQGNVVVKASAARNFRYPTLNDLYFRPGGNPDLKPERGWTWDAGVEFSTGNNKRKISGSATFFDSRIDDWILWVNTGTKLGIYTPLNLKRVHSYGVETRLNGQAALGRGWLAHLDGNFAWTRSTNQGDPFSPADESVGKQLVYIPEFSAAFTASLRWRRWALTYKWCYYSERYTMSSNELGVLGSVVPYYMSDIALEKRFGLRWAEISLKGSINNLLGEKYQSVMGRPMPGRNYALYIGITPKFRKR